MNKQVVFTGGEKVELQDAPIPSPGECQVLIKTKLTLISTGTELSVLSGKATADSVWNRLFSFPYVAGYTNVGEVIECGKGAPESLLGKKVAGHGCHAHYVVSGLDEIRDIPADIPDECSVFFNLAEIAMHGVRKGGIRWGDAVAIYGAGILGQLAAQFALMCGARRVFVMDISEHRLGLLPKHKRLVPVNSKTTNPREAVLSANDGRLVDIVYELTGNQNLIPSEFEILRDEGTMTIVSSPLGATVFDFHDLCNRTSVKIVGAHNFSHPKHETPDNPWTSSRDCAFYFDMYRCGDVDMSKMISTRAPYSKAPEIYLEMLRDRGSFMGVVLEWD